MKKRTFCFVLIMVSCFVQKKIIAQQTNIDVASTAGKTKINRDIYGHFAEHLGHCIYGGFYVGDTSKIPNTNGVRNDIIAALKKMKIPVLRWPGGCFADTYHWKDGIGPKDKRPAIVNRWWGGVTEDNSFGLHDFLNMCELLDTEPYLAGNIGSGTVQELADWVQYVSTNAKNPMSDLRRQNGRQQPWKVKFWGVGNEAWGCGGNMTPEYYVGEFRKYSTFMTDWLNSDKIFRVASGANVADYHWTETLMKNIPKNMVEGIALHHYSYVEWDSKGSAAAFTEQQYFKTLQKALFMDSLVINHSAIMDKYDPQQKIARLAELTVVRPNMTQSEMRDQLAHERALEFAIEAQRINDIIRWGWLYDATKLAELKAHDTDFNTWTPGNEYLPIPQQELDVNKNLLPNPAN